VPLSEYLDAVKKLEHNAPIENPRIMAVPNKPQQIMTIGLILDIVASFMTKIGEIRQKLDFKLKNIAASFNSHTHARINKALEEYDAATASG
jgi:hypothetical protein